MLKTFAVMTSMILFSAQNGHALEMQQEPEPSIQAHTLHTDILIRSLLQPVGNSKVTGTVEFQKKDNGARVLVALANSNGTAKKGEHYAVSLIDTKRCPQGEALSAKEGSGQELFQLATVKVKNQKIETSEGTLPSVKTEDEWKQLLARAVVVKKVTNGKPDQIISCGIAQSTSTNNPNKEASN